MLSKAHEDGVDISNLVKITVGMHVAEAMTHLHLYRVLHRDVWQLETPLLSDLIPKIGAGAGQGDGLWAVVAGSRG